MRRYAIFLIAIPVAVICVRLGFWQLSRLHQRRAFNAATRTAMAATPVSLSGRPPQVSPFYQVQGSGAFDYQRQVVVDAVSLDGIPGVVVVTPLFIWDSTAVLVERGWVASADGRTVDLGRLREGDSASIGGIVIEAGQSAGLAAGESDWPRHVLRPSPETLKSVYPYPILPYVIRRTSAPPVGSPLRPFPLPELTEGPHLGYAFQWFFFAVVALVGSVFIYQREQRRETVEGGRV
jgi:surfeit locus 1 family protein